MNLIHATMKRCVWLQREEIPDGEGGAQTTWRPLGEFRAAVNLINSSRQMNAEKYESAETYAVTVSIETELPFGGVFKRMEDGQCFRLTTDGTDKHPPEFSSLKIRRANAERLELPT